MEEEDGATMCAQSDAGVSAENYLQMGLNMLEMDEICEMFDRSHGFSTACRYCFVSAKGAPYGTPPKLQSYTKKMDIAMPQKHICPLRLAVELLVLSL